MSVRWILPALVFAMPALALETEGRNRDANAHYQVDPIVVTATRTERPLLETPVATELIQREEIEESGAGNVAEFLETKAGVSISHSIFGNGVELQGLGSEYVLVLIDGERIGGRKNGVLDLSRIPLSSIERIEIVKGNQSSLYGSEAIGGVLNLITRDSHSPVELDLSGSYFSSSQVDLGASLGKRGEIWKSRLSGGFRTASGHDWLPEDPETSVDAFRELSLSSHSELSLGEFSLLEGRTAYTRKMQEGVDGGTESFPLIFDRSNLIETFNASVGPRFMIGETGRLKGILGLSFYRDEYLQDQREGSVYDTFHETWEQLLQFSLQADRALPGGHQLSSGLEFLHEDLETERLQEGHSDRNRASWFLQDEWMPGLSGKLRVLPSFRFDRDSQFGFHFTPKLALRYDMKGSLVLRASLGNGYRAPDFKELYVHFVHPAVGYEIIGNPDLLPEVSRSASLALEWQGSRKLWASLSCFRHDFENLIQGIITDETSPGGYNLGVYVNVEEALVQGLEASLRVRDWGPLNAELSYSYLVPEDVTTGEVLEGKPKHRASLNLDTRLFHWKSKLILRGSWVGERVFHQSYSGVSSDTVPPYILLDLRLRQPLQGPLNLSVGLHNLLDAGDHDYLRIPPRRLSLGLQWSHNSKP
ncbi:MAG: TonB-dependent receptor [Candidatus Krumholzibacteria bacterium]|jgi:outer membrane receptor for ferrienterochelin and colicins|nr:TonB-dependent receptor [Candidatus Krumholzibacteria bacterium]